MKLASFFCDFVLWQSIYIFLLFIKLHVLRTTMPSQTPFPLCILYIMQIYFFVWIHLMYMTFFIYNSSRVVELVAFFLLLVWQSQYIWMLDKKNFKSCYCLIEILYRMWHFFCSKCSSFFLKMALYIFILLNLKITFCLQRPFLLEWKLIFRFVAPGRVLYLKQTQVSNYFYLTFINA